ncbi:MAG TPA: hypothetical protein VHA70_08825 [Bauldia sp.]|nr:hypothetical protein [Bauldia sp.]
MTTALVFVLAGLAGTSSLAGGEGGPAVSSTNAKISIEGGSLGGSGAGLGLGSITAPLSDTLGVQFDGAVGSADRNLMFGGGVHLFARDPSRYLIGAYASLHTWEGIDVWRAAGEFELYGDRISFNGLAGVEGVQYPSFWNGQPVTNQSSTHFFGQADLAYYPTDNLLLSGGVKYVNQTVLGTANAEYLLQPGSATPVSVFVDTQFGQGNYQQFMAGVRAYLNGGGAKSLLARHRTDDPPNYTPVFSQLVVAGPSLCVHDVDDKNPCTTDTCDPQTGRAIHTQVSCDDGDSTTMDTCNPIRGCVHTVVQ